MDVSNTCALLVRTLTLLLLLYSVILSTMVMSSCHFLSALTPTGEPHGVGITSFELENGQCSPHTSFITSHYNGMENIAKVCGYVAPSVGALAGVLILVECCLRSSNYEWFSIGKCFPCLLLVGAVTCQGLTFVLFQSELFCGQSDTIDKCIMDTAAYRSVQATICYFICFILYLCGRTPTATAWVKLQKGGMGDTTTTTTTAVVVATTKKKKSEKSSNNNNNKTNKTKKKKTGEYTKEDYENRRKERKIKGRGVSGRSKQEIYHDLGGGSSGDNKKPSSSPKKTKQSSRNNSRGGRGGRSSSIPRGSSKERKFDDYDDTEPVLRRSGGGGGGEDDRDREYYDEEEQRHHHYQRTNNVDDDDNYSDEYSGRDMRGGGGDEGSSRYSDDRSGYLGTVYDDDEIRYSRDNSRGSRYSADNYNRSGRSNRDRYADDDGVSHDDDYTKDEEDTYGESYDRYRDSRRGDEYDQDSYNDSYYTKRSHNDTSDRFSERKGGYDEASYNDASYNDASYADDSRFGEGGYYHDERSRDDSYYDGPPLT